MTKESLFELNLEVSNKLIHTSNEKTDFKPKQNLIFPFYRDEEKIRFSEQESRVLFCDSLNRRNLFYSIETPTLKRYQFSGKESKSAQSDLTMYSFEGNEFKREVNVEFKFGNPKKEQIKKDIEKILRENYSANWFHTLKNIDSNTFPNLFKKFEESFKNCYSSEKCQDFTQLDIVFCFCVIEKKTTFLKHFYCDKNNLNSYVSNFFTIIYEVRRGEIIIEDLNGWEVIKIK